MIVRLVNSVKRGDGFCAPQVRFADVKGARQRSLSGDC